MKGDKTADGVPSGVGHRGQVLYRAFSSLLDEPSAETGTPPTGISSMTMPIVWWKPMVDSRRTASTPLLLSSPIHPFPTPSQNPAASDRLPCAIRPQDDGGTPHLVVSNRADCASPKWNHNVLTIGRHCHLRLLGKTFWQENLMQRRSDHVLPPGTGA